MNESKEDFEDYVKVVKNLKVVGEEPHLIRIGNDDHTFAHIELLPAGDGQWNLRVYEVSSNDDRKVVKWISGVSESEE